MRSMKNIAILLIAMGLLVTGCENGGSEDAVPTLMEPAAASAENTIQTVRMDLYSAKYLDAMIVPQTEELYFLMDGAVETIDVVEGEVVEEGQVLMTLNQEALKNSILDLQEEINYADSTYAMRVEQADLDIQIAKMKLEKLQSEYEAQEQKKAEEALKKAEEEARKKAEEEARQKAEEEAKKKAEEEAANSAANQESSVVSQESSVASQESSVVSQESSVASQESSVVSQESSVVSQESSVVSQESSVVSQESSVVSQESSVVNQESSVANQESSVVNQESSVVNQDSGSADQGTNNNQDATLPENTEKEEDKKPAEPEITKYDLQRAALAVQQAELTYSQLVDDYNQEMGQKQNEMQSLLNKVGEDTLTAPFAGRVVSINYSVGDYVREYDEVIILVNENVKMLRGEKYYNDALQLAENLDVIINGNTYDIAYIPYDDDEYLRGIMNGESLPTWFEFDCPDEFTFGESGTIRVYNYFSENALAIPASCIQKDELGDFVYKAEDGQRVKTYVTLGVTTSSFAEVIDGLKEGDEVYGIE